MAGSVSPSRREPVVVAVVRPPRVAVTLLWMALIGLVALGVVVVGLRWLFPADAATRLEPLRQTPIGVRAADAFVIALWIGWTATFAVTEWWIRRTRPAPS